MEDGGTFVLFPEASLEGKNNYKQYYFILPDGLIQKRVFLDVLDDRHREFLICVHYIMWSAKIFFSEGDGINIVSVDSPWDFELSVNNIDNFFVEITAIADNDMLHIINKREQRFAINRNKEEISFHELNKLNDMFPSNEISADIERYRKLGLNSNDNVKNPWFENKNIFTSILPPPEGPLDQLIRSAIQRKMDKTHSNKARTVLIIDNRTSLFDCEEIFSASSKLGVFFQQCPFPEIWFYTGYFSDNDGQNSEFSFIAFKLPSDRESRYLAAAANRTPDKKGRYLIAPDSKF